MYITISPQKIAESYSKCFEDFVEYLEKKNAGRKQKKQEAFFSHTPDASSQEEKRAILSTKFYQFFEKVNEPDTSKYYESFFEMMKRKSVRISKSGNPNFDTRTTKMEPEVAKTRADLLFSLKPSELVTNADGKDRKVKFTPLDWAKELPLPKHRLSADNLELNFKKLYCEAKAIYKSQDSQK